LTRGRCGAPRLDLDAVAAALLKYNMEIHTLGRYYLGPHTRTGLIFGYGAFDLPEIRQGLSHLREAV
jgi:GntR family transcriptional regulator/MocR family aminotransferase